MALASTSNKNEKIVFCGPKVHVLKCFAEHHGYNKVGAYLGNPDDFIAKEARYTGQALKVLDYLYDTLNKGKTEEKDKIVNLNYDKQILPVLKKNFDWQPFAWLKARHLFTENSKQIKDET